MLVFFNQARSKNVRDWTWIFNKIFNFYFPRYRSAILFTLAAVNLIGGCQASILMCDFRNDDFWNRQQQYACIGSVIGEGEVRVIDRVWRMNGHEHGLSDYNVTAVTVSNFLMHAVPRNIETHFPNLKSMSLLRLRIRKIESSDFRNVPDLVHLDLSDNEIQAISADAFTANSHLEAINLSQNPLRHIAHYVFRALTNLQSLELNRSGCVDAQFTGTGWNAFQFELILRCPPTSEMIGDEIFVSDEFVGMKNKLRQLRYRITRSE